MAARVKFKQSELLELVRRETSKRNRVPSKREVKQLADLCVKAFGSWNTAIKQADLNPNRSHAERMYQRSRTKARDGHERDSISEALVDDWLQENEIKHERDYPYPEGRYTTDWMILVGSEKIFVEYFGLAHSSQRYDKTIRQKRALCKKYGVKLIEIYPWNLYPTKNFKQFFEKYIS